MQKFCKVGVNLGYFKKRGGRGGVAASVIFLDLLANHASTD